jgi:hypothetical protein
LRLGVDQRANRTLDCGSGNENVHGAKMDPHPVDCGANLLKIPDIGPESQGRAARVLDLELGQIQLRLAARQQAHTRAGGGKTQRQALADAPAASRDKDSLVFYRQFAIFSFEAPAPAF